MMHDPELPAGFQDADFDMRELEAAGARSSALKRRGICDHGWTKPADPSDCTRRGRILCNHCGAIFDNEQAHMDARREARQS